MCRSPKSNIPPKYSDVIPSVIFWTADGQRRHDERANAQQAAGTEQPKEVSESKCEQLPLPNEAKLTDASDRLFWRKLHWWDFEIAVLLAFESKGFRAEASPPSADGGLDGIIESVGQPAPSVPSRHVKFSETLPSVIFWSRDGERAYSGRSELAESDESVCEQQSDEALESKHQQPLVPKERYGVQCKHYGRHDYVTVAEIRDFIGALVGSGLSRGLFVTTGKYSTPAIDLVQSDLGHIRVDLLTLKDLVLLGLGLHISQDDLSKAKSRWGVPEEPPPQMRYSHRHKRRR